MSGSRTPSHHNHALTNFREQLEICTERAICGREFIHTSRLKEWLLSASSTVPDKTQLELLLPKDPDQPEPLLPSHALVDKNALIVFCILLQLDKARCIESFFRASIYDTSLPKDFSSLHESLRAEHDIGDAQSLAKDFTTAQSKFCSPVFDLDGTKNHTPNQILPILHKEKINKGGTAQLWLIEVPEEFVGEGLRKEVEYSRIREKDGLGYRYKFALKSFVAEHIVQFNNEKKAFANLRNNNNVVRCLASYSHANTHNLLLEYGEMDLEVYFVNHHPPFFEQEVVRFWREILEVAKAIEGMHDWKSLHDGKKYHGWHADIKPDNILLVNGKFKLADPGFVKFVRHTTENPEETVEGCTWTWSAPERIPGQSNPVTQKIDIWSFGCVLSIAATWVAGGYSAIRDFTRVRRKSLDSTNKHDASPSGLPPGDLFHDGNCVLGDVTEWHKLLRGTLRRTDPITDGVLDLIDQRMLLQSPEARIDAHELCKKLGQLLESCPQESSSPMSSRLQSALLEIDEQADANPLIIESASSAQRLTDSSGTADNRVDRKSKILATPLKKTAHRSEYLNSVLPGSSHQPAHDIQHDHPAPKDPPAPPVKSHRASKSVTQRPPPLKRSETPHTPRNFFQALNERRIESERSKFSMVKRKKKAKRDYLAKRFDNRDIRFLVDNGATMMEHWDHATLLLEELVERANGLDKNGVDAFFTCGDDKVQKTSDGSKFRKAMLSSGVEPQEGVETDMEDALAKIFQDHLEYLRSPWGQTKKKHLTIYILTDGIWKGTIKKTVINDKIADFLQQVTSHVGTIPKKPATISFIQFGHDPDATYRLQYLDDDLKFEKNIDDAIDTEAATGDLNKMLLGSIVDIYDNLEHQVLSPHKADNSSQFLPLSLAEEANHDSSS